MNTKAKPMRAIIVDDNRLMRTILGAFLRQEGYDVVAEFSNAASFMESVGQHAPDIVCLDILLPDGDGLDLLTQLHQAYPLMAIVMITGSIHPDVRQKAADCGASGFLQKPFSQDQVVRELEQIRHAHNLLLHAKNKTTPVARGINVVIADDSLTMRLLLTSILENMGLTVVGAGCDGQQAVDLATHYQPELVCLDIEMPKLSGLDALTQLKAINPAMRIVMVTGHAESSTVKQALVAGAAGYILKPYQTEQVAAVLQKLLS